MIETIIIANLIATSIVALMQARNSDQTDRLISLMENHLHLENENKTEIQKLHTKNARQDEELQRLKNGFA